MTSLSKHINAFYVGLFCCLATCFVNFGILNNDFVVTWDDSGYIINNPHIRDFSWKGIKKIFTVFVEGNYHPLTVIVHALQYKLFSLQPKGYHAFSLLLHVCNTGLVFWFIYLLRQHIFLALFVALLFGVHPMHVESVAWVSELKDLLYVFFFLLACIFYYFYTSGKNILLYFFCIGAFLLSLLSKQVAMSLPLIMIIIDLHKGEKLSWALLKDKTVFFVMSLIFGVLAIIAQDEAGAVGDLSTRYGNIDRLVIFFYQFSFYVLKMFVPFGQSSLYLYPQKTNGFLPMEFYLYPLVFALLVSAFIYISNKELKRNVGWGLAFYLLNILFMVQIIPVGRAVVAERYTYLSYAGLFYACGSLLLPLLEQERLRNVLFAAITSVLILFSYLTVQRIKIWKDGITLFMDVIKKYPDNCESYSIVGWAYTLQHKKKEAVEYYSKAIQCDPKDYKSISNRGQILDQMGLHKEAIKSFDLCLQLREDFRIYHNRGIARYNLGDYRGAIDDFNQSVLLNPAIRDGLTLRGNAKYQLNDFQGAISDFDLYIKYNPANPEAFVSRGSAKARLQQYEEAAKDFNEALKLNDRNPTAWFNRGNCFKSMNNMEMACNDWSNALKLGYKPAGELLKKYCVAGNAATQPKN